MSGPNAKVEAKVKASLYVRGPNKGPPSVYTRSSVFRCRLPSENSPKFIYDDLFGTIQDFSLIITKQGEKKAAYIAVYQIDEAKNLPCIGKKVQRLEDLMTHTVPELMHTPSRAAGPLGHRTLYELTRCMPR